MLYVSSSCPLFYVTTYILIYVSLKSASSISFSFGTYRLLTLGLFSTELYTSFNFLGSKKSIKELSRSSEYFIFTSELEVIVVILASSVLFTIIGMIGGGGAIIVSFKVTFFFSGGLGSGAVRMIV